MPPPPPPRPSGPAPLLHARLTLPRRADLHFTPEFGVTHTAEITYVFDQPTYVFGAPTHPQSCAFSAADAAIARDISGLWGTFARSGAPRPGAFSAYNASRDQEVVLGRPGGALPVEPFWRARYCEALGL